MPEIIKESKQVAALTKIESNLTKLKSINLALSGDCSFTITTTVSGKTCKIAVDGKEAKKIISILTSQRARLVKDSISLAGKNRISFSESEEKILNGTDLEKSIIPETAIPDSDENENNSDNEMECIRDREDITQSFCNEANG